MNKDFVTFPIGRYNIRKFYYNEIFYFKASGSYSTIKLKHEEFIISKNLMEITKIINHKKFIRVSRSHLVNLDLCLEIITNKHTFVILRNKEKIKLGRKYLENFHKYFYS